MLLQVTCESGAPVEKHDSHECHNLGCAKRFRVVYRHDPQRLPLPLNIACPHCGVREFLFVGTLGRVEPDGTYVMSFDYRIEVAEP